MDRSLIWDKRGAGGDGGGDAAAASPSSSAPDERTMRFLAGEDVLLDRHLLAYDIRASQAHARGLQRIGVLTADESQRLVAALEELLADWKEGRFALDERYEDGHSAIEAWLTQCLGDVGRKVHTGRSRNDQVLAAIRLFLRDALEELEREAWAAARVFLDRALADEKTPMPGYTHLQRAVPSTVGLWCGAFAEAFLDDANLVRFTRQWIDCSPLGTAAGYGVNLPLDREGVARDLGFTRVQNNAMYAQNSRGKFEWQALTAAAQCLLDARRFAWDVSLFTTEEFAIVRLPDRLTTGSSIMPNKRNPDTAELLRAACATVEGAMVEIQSVLSLPSGYQRDLQAIKAPTIRGLRHALSAMPVLTDVARSMEFDRGRMAAAVTPAMLATDRAVELAVQGVPFREAYRRIARQLEEGDAGSEVEARAGSHSADLSAAIAESIAKRVSSGGAGHPGLPELQRRIGAR